MTTATPEPPGKVSLEAGPDEPEANAARTPIGSHCTPPETSPMPWPKHVGGPRYTERQTEALLHEMKGET